MKPTRKSARRTEATGRARKAGNIERLTGTVTKGVDESVDLTPIAERVRPWVKEYRSANFHPAGSAKEVAGVHVKIRQWGDDGDGNAPKLYRRCIYIDAEVGGMRSVVDLPASVSPIHIDMACVDIEDAEEFALALLTLIREAREENAVLQGRY